MWPLCPERVHVLLGRAPNQVTVTVPVVSRLKLKIEKFDRRSDSAMAGFASRFRNDPSELFGYPSHLIAKISTEPINVSGAEPNPSITSDYLLFGS